MNRFRRFLAAFAVAAALPAAATTSSTDYTDLWYLPAESGWGVNIVQQLDIVFATFFLYGPDNTPRWYVAPDTRMVSAPPGENLFSGSLYSTVGTWFGAPWGGPTQNTQVGSVAFSFVSPTTGAVSYTINGVTVTKSIFRQTWRNNFLGGNYFGGLTANQTNCRNGQANDLILIVGEMTVGHSNFANPNFRVTFVNSGVQATCTFTGGYVQEGRLGRIASGTFSCSVPGSSNAPAGTFTMSQIEANTNGMTARFTGTTQNCSWDGYFGGTRDVL